MWARGFLLHAWLHTAHTGLSLVAKNFKRPSFFSLKDQPLQFIVIDSVSIG